jgi:hypothetical protein
MLGRHLFFFGTTSLRKLLDIAAITGFVDWIHIDFPKSTIHHFAFVPKRV